MFKVKLFSLITASYIKRIKEAIQMPTWDLTFFYNSPHDERIKIDLEEGFNKAKQLKQKYYSKLSDPSLTSSQMKEFFVEYEDLVTKVGLTAQYANLIYAADTSNELYQKLAAVCDDYLAKIEMELSFSKPSILKQSEHKLIEFIESEELKDYRHVIEKLLKSKQHVLSEDAEKVLAAMYNSSRGGFQDLYQRLTSSYIFEIEVDGMIRTLTEPQMRSLRMHPDKDVRRRAMKILLDRYEKDQLVIEKTYNSIVKNYDTEASLRNFQEPISMRNLENEVEDEIVKTVIEVTTDNSPLVHRYYNWKTQKMGLTLTLADIYAPLMKERKEYSFDEAKEIVLDAYYSFDEEFGQIAEYFFTEKRIDSDIRKGKRGGAFTSYVVPNKKPFILMNYTGNMNDIMTLAHELGHGIHGVLASKQNIWNFHPPLVMAEVASVFGEMLVMDAVLPTLSEEERMAFIASKIEDTFATMFRQNMFARFEITSHKMISDNGSATWKELSDLYNQELKIMFGDSVIIPDEYHFEWSSIPHMFHTPFYVYAYNFANLLVLALYEQYKIEGKSFVPKYKELLSSGASDSPEKLLQRVGIDINQKDFWKKGFEFIEKEFLSKLD